MRSLPRMTDTLVELTLPAPIDTAWAHLREPALIRRWFGWDHDGLEHEIEVIFRQEAAVDDRAHTLEWGDGIQEGDRFALTDLGERTQLRVTRPAPAGGGYDEIGEGWITFAQQLRFALAHPDGERHTLRLTRDGTLPPLPEGDEWFRSEHQTGIVIGAGELLVAAQAPERASAIITSYGAAPDEAQWRAWWD
jgi:hypothetical protein